MLPNFVRTRQRTLEQFSLTTKQPDYSLTHRCERISFLDFLQKRTVHVSMELENSMEALSDSFHNENTNTHHFGCHDHTHSQRHCNFAECDPLVLVQRGCRPRSFAPLSIFQYYRICPRQLFLCPLPARA